MNEFKECEIGISMFEYKMDKIFNLKPNLKRILKTCVYYACLHRDVLSMNKDEETLDKITFKDMKMTCYLFKTALAQMYKITEFKDMNDGELITGDHIINKTYLQHLNEGGFEIYDFIHCVFLMETKTLDGVNDQKRKMSSLNFKKIIQKMPSGNTMAEEKQRKNL